MDYPAAQALAGSVPGLDRENLAGQLRHVDRRHAPQDLEIDLEVAVHDAVAGGDDLGLPRFDG
jgi:hypothetical protein